MVYGLDCERNHSLAILCSPALSSLDVTSATAGRVVGPSKYAAARKPSYFARLRAELAALSGPAQRPGSSMSGTRVNGYCTGVRSNSSTVRLSRIGSIGCGTAASARDQLASQASSRRPVSTTIGGP